MVGKNQSVGKGHTKWLGGPGCGPRAAYCTPLFEEPLFAHLRIISALF